MRTASRKHSPKTPVHFLGECINDPENTHLNGCIGAELGLEWAAGRPHASLNRPTGRPPQPQPRQASGSRPRMLRCIRPGGAGGPGADLGTQEELGPPASPGLAQWAWVPETEAPNPLTHVPATPHPTSCIPHAQALKTLRLIPYPRTWNQLSACQQRIFSGLKVLNGLEEIEISKALGQSDD